jgi:hypothetical protein
MYYSQTHSCNHPFLCNINLFTEKVQVKRNSFNAILNCIKLVDKHLILSERLYSFLLLFLFILWGGTKSLGTAAISGLLYKPQMIDEGDCRAIGGMKIGRGNQSTWRKPAPAPLCPPQIPHDQTRARTRAAAVGSQ